MNTKCANCGGDYGIHQSETNRCPFGGVDQTMRKNPMYTNLVYTPEVDNDDDIETLREEVNLLHIGLRNALRRIEVLEKELAATVIAVECVEHNLDVHTRSPYNPHQI